jgi:microcin C transport system permease protein
MFATLYMFTLLGLLTRIITDITYSLVDPRITFGGRGVARG